MSFVRLWPRRRRPRWAHLLFSIYMAKLNLNSALSAVRGPIDGFVYKMINGRAWLGCAVGADRSFMFESASKTSTTFSERRSIAHLRQSGWRSCSHD